MQLDLFAQPSKPATVLPFPLARRAGLVSETAQALASRSYAMGQRFWSKHLREHRRALHEAGLSPEKIKEEIGRYSRAVAREVVILRDYRQSVPKRDITKGAGTSVVIRGVSPTWQIPG